MISKKWSASTVRPSSGMAIERTSKNGIPASPLEIEVGNSHPLGATLDANGVNFSVFADRATAVELLLFNGHEDTLPYETISLDPLRHKTFYFWHVYVKGLKPGVHYAY